MKPTDPILHRIFSLAAPPPPSAPSPRLEARVISAWRNRNAGPEFTPNYRAALGFACGVLLLASAVSLGPLFEPASPTILLANAALHEAIQP